MHLIIKTIIKTIGLKEQILKISCIISYSFLLIYIHQINLKHKSKL